MDSRELPDLTDWRTIEAWTLEEAAMLWAAIDPFDHPDIRINELRKEVPFSQRRKAMVYQRAAVEAVCAGTLPFLVAKESHEDNGYDWIAVISSQNLPDRDKIIPHQTVVKSAAFMSWAKSKRMQSYRQLQSKSEKSVVIQAPIPALPKPDFRDLSNPRVAKELIVAMDSWEVMADDDYIEGVSLSPKQMAKNAIENHPIGKNLSAAAKDRVSTVINWKQEGGCPKTPGG